MSAPSLRDRAAAQDAVADRLSKASDRIWTDLCRARRSGDVEAARVLEIRFSAANRGVERACSRALDLRIKAAGVEHAAARASDLINIAA